MCLQVCHAILFVPVMMYMLFTKMFYKGLIVSVGSVSTLSLLIYAVRTYFKLRRYFRKGKAFSVGFFHPYCNAGGGGERVLWCAVRTIQNSYSDATCIIYTGDSAPGTEILQNAQKRFNIHLPRPVQFVYLKRRNWLEAENYPYFTLLFQSLASFLLGLEAMLKYVPDVYIETMGYAFTYPIFKILCACTVGAYVHYPTISTDMLSSVYDQRVAVHNREFISQSRLLTRGKLIYYWMFSFLYGFMGRQSAVVMVNSSWTRGHILKLWQKPGATHLVYPPCDTKMFETLPLRSGLNLADLRIISIAQFRPEKNLKLQLESLKCFLDRMPERRKSTKLVLIGGCRHSKDYELVEELKRTTSELSIEQNVEFKINLPFRDVLEEMKNADIALHSMWNEHFGIGIVECMSAGLIMIAHNSGGPKLDIIRDKQTGFLADDVESYADALEHVHRMSNDKLSEMRLRARESAQRFSEEVFERTFLDAVQALF